MCFLVSLCVPVKLSATCHIPTCFFVDVVHFSLMTTLFCFISLDTLLGNFLVVVLSAYVCAFLVCFLHLVKAFCIVSCHDLFLC